MQLLDWLIVLLYLVASLGLGLWLGRRASTSIEEFFVSGRPNIASPVAKPSPEHALSP